MSDREPMTRDTAIDELLGAYALDACEPGEIETVEAYLERVPEAAVEVARLRQAAAWIGATEALAPPSALRDSLFDAALARRSPNTKDAAVAAYSSETDRWSALLDTLQPDDLAAPTANGLSVRDLVIHLAAMETMAAAAVASPAAPFPTSSTDVETRTARFVAAFAPRPITEARTLWSDAVGAVRRWAATGSTNEIPWLGFDVERETLLAARAFETWTHADDIRRALGRRLQPPPPEALHTMADLSMRTLAAALTLSGREHPDRSARIILTGAGGGEWTVPLAWGATPGDEPDIEIRADVIAWCRVASERLEPDALAVEAQGDLSLLADLLVAASVFATL